jgi:hypothetical protein
MSQSKFLMAGVSAVAASKTSLLVYLVSCLVGGLIYFLAKDSSVGKFDPKVHTKEMLH